MMDRFTINSHRGISKNISIQAARLKSQMCFQDKRTIYLVFIKWFSLKLEIVADNITLIGTLFKTGSWKDPFTIWGWKSSNFQFSLLPDCKTRHFFKFSRAQTIKICLLVLQLSLSPRGHRDLLRLEFS